MTNEEIEETRGWLALVELAWRPEEFFKPDDHRHLPEVQVPVPPGPGPRGGWTLDAVKQFVREQLSQESVTFDGTKWVAEPKELADANSPVARESDQLRIARLQMMDTRFQMVINDYKARGTPKPMIDTFHDLTQVEKAVLYERAVMWKKGRKPKNNPYHVTPEEDT